MRKEYQEYSISPCVLDIPIEILDDCPPGLNQRPLEKEFVSVVQNVILESGVSPFVQSIAVVLNEELVSDLFHN